MPINRTPPPASPVPVSSDDTSQSQTTQTRAIDAIERTTKLHSESAPDIPPLTLNVSERKKRKHDGVNPNIMSYMSEMFSVYTNEQAKHFKDLQIIVSSIKEQNDGLKKRASILCQASMMSFYSRLSVLEAEKRQDRYIIQQLQEKIENMERKSRFSGIEIRNIPKNNEESKENLCSTVKKLGECLNVNLQDSDIKDVYRTNSKTGTRPIIVEFNSVIIKEKMLHEVKKFNKTKPKNEKLNTSHLNYSQKNIPIYVTETLTQNTQKLFYQARIFQKSHKYLFCWTSRGIVYLRKNENSSQIRINNETDIENLRKTE
ncbi:unnamed protein product [Parnassius apollo]|uniref:(apollo) hypothetical protein n=1 Tax=Parnassius apollo TaxID=110799 RepID=A0A8S3X2Y9_PARAO|nr:unnamed protein product [Parnassius apollo]